MYFLATQIYTINLAAIMYIISDDKSPRQLTYLKSLRTTLQNRIDNGEANLTIKYVQGKPTIVTISKNKEN